MKTRHKSLRRLSAGAATGALVASGLLLISPAAQAAGTVTVTNSDLAPTEATYAGWHQGYENAEYASAITAEGLGMHGKSQIINGYKNNSNADLAAGGVNADVSSLIGAQYDVTSGVAYFQLPLFVDVDGDGPGAPVFTTLRPAAYATTDTTIAAGDSWVSSKAFGDIAANTPMTLQTLVDAIDADGSTSKTIGFGVLTQSPYSAVVSSISFNGTTYDFKGTTSSSTVTNAGVAGEETSNNYTSWHQGYDNASKNQQVTAEGLELAGKSQVIKGLNDNSKNVKVPNVNLIFGLPEASYTVESGQAYFQIALFYDNGDGVKYTTLRNAVQGTGTNTLDLTSDWESSQNISDAVPANAERSFLQILAELGKYKVVGYGVLTSGDDAAVVSNITFGGTSTTFADAPEAATTEKVQSSDVAPNEDTYAGWHQGAGGDATISDGALNLGADRSQVINGYANNSENTSKKNVDLAEALRTGSYTVRSGDVFFQVPLFFEDSNGDTQFTTLRPAVKAHEGTNTFSIGDEWVSSKQLGDLAANTPAQLGDILSSIGSYKVLGFGVYSDAGGNGAVRDITWDGTKYLFSDAPTAAPVKAAVQAGATVSIPLLGSGADGDDLTYDVPAIAHGTGEVEGDTLTFSADKSFHGAATFSYTVTNGDETATGTIKVNVGRATSHVALTTTPVTPTVNQSVTVHVVVTSTGNVHPGVVNIYDGSKLVGTGKAHTSGLIDIKLSKKLTAGTHTIRAKYLGTTYTNAKSHSITVKVSSK